VALSVMEERLPRGAEPPPRVPHREDEAFVVLEGRLTVETDEVPMLTLCWPGGVEQLFLDDWPCPPPLAFAA
jgi:hypothetical protein